MRTSRSSVGGAVEGLSFKQLRCIEKSLGVYLEQSRVGAVGLRRSRVDVYDEAEIHVGDVQSDGPKFTVEELTTKIIALFGSHVYK